MEPILTSKSGVQIVYERLKLVIHDIECEIRDGHFWNSDYESGIIYALNKISELLAQIEKEYIQEYKEIRRHYDHTEAL